MKKFIVWYFNKSTKDYTDGGMQYDDLSTAETFADTNSQTRGVDYIIEEADIDDDGDANDN